MVNRFSHIILICICLKSILKVNFLSFNRFIVLPISNIVIFDILVIICTFLKNCFTRAHVHLVIMCRLPKLV